jgi:hypothetical protein
MGLSTSSIDASIGMTVIPVEEGLKALHAKSLAPAFIAT